MSTIRRIPTSQVDGNDANTDNASEIRPYGEIGLYEGNNDKLELLISDGQRTHFKSKVLAKGTFYGGDADSGDNNGYDTIKLIPDVGLVENNGSNQYIIIDPTGPNHVHIRAGGTIDNSNSELILGGENSYVKIGAFENPPVLISSNSNNWTFGTDASLTVPGVIQNSNSFQIQAGTAPNTVEFLGQIDNGFGDGPGATLHVTSIIYGTITDGMTIYGEGLPAEGWTVQFGTVMEPQGNGGNGNYYLPGANYLIGSQLFDNGDAPNSTWTFGTNGTLTFPDGTTQITAARQTAAVDWTANHTLVDGTRYIINDVVYSSGNLYRAKADNESLPVTNDTYWESLGPGYRLNIDGRDIPNIPYPVTSVNGLTGDVDVPFITTWSSSVTYNVGDIVVNDNLMWQAVAESTNSEPTTGNSTHWTLLSATPNITWRGEWNNTTSYVANDLVNYNGSTYIAINSITGTSPTGPMGMAYWQLFTEKGDVGPNIIPWIIGGNYMDGTVVLYNNELYEALSDNNSWVNPNEVPGAGDNWLIISNTASSIITIAKNESGSTISKMSVVYISGGSGNRPVISLAQADSESTSSKAYGVTAEDITDGHFGKVVALGALMDVNTNSFAVAEGTTLYLSPTTPGGLTTTKPSAPNHLVSIGKIVRNHNNHGVIQVNIQNGFELQELHNVAIGDVDNGDLLRYYENIIDPNQSYWGPYKLNANDIDFSNVPTSDPVQPGKVWIDTTNGNVLKVSTGV